MIKTSLLVSLLISIPVTSGKADSDGTFAFGDGYAVVTQFAPQGGQSLNVIPLQISHPLKFASSIELPVSNSSIVTHRKTVFVRWWKTLFVFQLNESWDLTLIHKFELPKPQVRWVGSAAYSIFVQHNTLLLYNDPHDTTIDLSAPISEWTLKRVATNPDPTITNWKFSRQGDWIPIRGSCLDAGEYKFCLALGESNKAHAGGNTIYHDKYLVKRKSDDGTWDSVLHLHTSEETVH